MKLQISSNDFVLTPAIKKYLLDKLGKLEKFSRRFGTDFLFEVSISRIAHRHHGENLELVLNLHLPKKIIRSHERGTDVFVLTDAVEAEILRQLKAEKEKSLARVRKGARKAKTNS